MFTAIKCRTTESVQDELFDLWQVFYSRSTGEVWNVRRWKRSFGTFAGDVIGSDNASVGALGDTSHSRYGGGAVGVALPNSREVLGEAA